MTIYKDIRNNVTNDIAHEIKDLKALRNLRRSLIANKEVFPELPAGIHFWTNFIGIFATIYVQLPWDSVLADQVLLAFTRLGWAVDHERDNVAGYAQYEWYLRHTVFEGNDIELQVQVYMDAEVKGSKCNLITTKKMVEKSFFEVRCADTVNV